MDAKKTYLIEANFSQKFVIFYHPHTNLFLEMLDSKSMENLMSNDLQVLNRTKFKNIPAAFNSEITYDPLHVVSRDVPETIDFSYSNSNSIYNWEVFFHLPYLMADALRKDQKFKEAMQ
ncbi:MAG: hypothetical protein IPK03_03240 [Bacteroidetes bacterium]|nr:hypothetical protein [Bacteroidota bacterium]